MAYQQQQVPVEMKPPLYPSSPLPAAQMQSPPQPHLQSPPLSAPIQLQYQHATPIASLLQTPAPVDCPVCRNRALTRVEYVAGGFTTLIAFALLGTCCCCLPYFIDGTKNAKHYCGSCNVLLATWHRSGHGTDVHQHA